MLKKIIFLLLLFTGVLLFWQCSTNKNTFSRRFYHNLTAHYNVYFNGHEAYKEGVLSVEETHEDKYNEILPLFYYSDKEALSAASANMDRAIEKSSKLIALHSLTKKPKMPKGPLNARQKAFYAKKEYCNWIDDAYLLMGRAHFYKQEYYSAIKNFNYLNTEYKDSDIRYYSTLWLARCKVESGMYEDAELVLDMLMQDTVAGSFPEKLYDDYYTILADDYIKQEKYDKAIENLEKAISFTKRKKIARRYTYILAQLYHETGSNAKAAELYEEVLDMNPAYVMAFNAKISLATSFESGNSAEVEKILFKLLKDKKNEEFQDQIYYALANVAMKKGNRSKALEYYKLSIEKSESNNYQKSMSFLAIGNIYFEDKQYIASQPFYDSCVNLLDEEYRGYRELKVKSENLNDLAYNYKIAMYEDSVQKVAKMSPKERDKLISKLIDAYKEEVAEQERLAQIQRENTQLYNQEFGSDNSKTGATFYFYNPSVVNFGKTEFKNKWGDRKLEDNWRRKNKTEDLWDDEDDDEETLEEDSLKVKKTLDKTSREYYLQNLPLNDSLLALSQKRKDEAMFNVGTIFMTKFEFDDEAINSYKEYLVMLPDGEYAPMVTYYLYRLYNKNNDEENANKYKKIIISKYPETVFAKALTNPNYLKEYELKEAKLDKLYKETYRAFLKGSYGTVIENVEKSKRYEGFELLPKFEFLKAVAVGRMNSVDVLKKELEKIVKDYEEDTVAIFAKKIIDYLQNEDVNKMLAEEPDAIIAPPTEDVVQEEKPEIYFFKEEEPHKFVLAFNPILVDGNRLKFNLINYNLDYFSNFNFKLEEKILSPSVHLICVSPLSDNSQATNYYQLINLSNDVFEGVDKESIEHFIISDENYKTLIKDGDLKRYMDFYLDNYSI